MKIIAESAFNHNGDLDYTLRLADAALAAGADYFTVQVMDVAAFCVENYSKYDIYENHTLSFDEWSQVFAYCREIGIELIPCVLDIPSFDFCYAEGFRFIKLHATDITNKSMMEKMSGFRDVQFILETQCATNLEIKFALKYIGEQVVCLMHGFSNYPTEVEDLNLNALDYFRQEYPQYQIGLADHSLDIDKIPLMAMAKGCDYLEKHITLTRNNRQFDYQVSLYPREFGAFVELMAHYRQALGPTHKHPTKTELGYRDVMYKKDLGGGSFKRADEGEDYLTHHFNSSDKSKAGIALIARLKSQRLPLKVLKPMHESVLIDFLYKRLDRSERVHSTYLSTSTLDEDSPLAEEGVRLGHRVYRGHAISVIDRMLELALEQGYGSIFRVTGDNPFTDVGLIDEMVDLMVDHDLDYVRVNNVPFGVSAELFSTSYLWKLYLEMDDPMSSEYLTLFILNDENARKGCIDIESDIRDLRYINLSVDYQDDLDRVYQLLEKLPASDRYTAGLAELLPHLDGLKREDKTKKIKLPKGETVDFEAFLDRLANQAYTVRKPKRFD